MICSNHRLHRFCRGNLRNLWIGLRQLFVLLPASRHCLLRLAQQELGDCRFALLQHAIATLGVDSCSKCGRAIDDTRLDIDPALALCLDCWSHEPAASIENERSEINELLIENLNPFDTIVLRTHNSDYRMLLLDPKTGRALVEGGDYLLEPNEAVLQGSAVAGDELKPGEICVGCRLEVWVKERVFLTSPVIFINVKHNDAAESVKDISAALH